MKLHLPNMLRKALLACMAALAGISTAIGAEYTLTTGISYTPSGGSATIVDGYTNPNVEGIEYESTYWPSSITAASLNFTITPGGLYGADAIEENGLFSLDSLVIKVSGAKWCQDGGRTITLTSGAYTYTAELEDIFSGPGGTDGNVEGLLTLTPEDFFLSKDSEVAVSIKPASENETDTLSVATANIQGKNEATVSWSGVSGIDIKSDWNNEAPLVQVRLTTDTPGSGGTPSVPASTQLNLPSNSDFTWVAGSNASGIGNSATTATIVQNLAAAIENPDIGNTDLSGWFGGTGQGHTSDSELSIVSDNSFTFHSRPKFSGEYVALGVELEEAASSISLSFTTDNPLGYSLWSYDSILDQATELIGMTVQESGSANAVYEELVEESQLFVVWTSNPNGQYSATPINVTDISLSYVAAPGTDTPGSGGTPSVPAGTQLNLPGNSDYTWVAGSNAAGIGTGATSADIVQNLAAAIKSPTIGNTDLTGWFVGTGQAYDANSYPDDISIISSTSFSFKSRPALSGEYVALGVKLTEAADSITLTFDTTNKLGYSLWSYDGTTATELVGLTYQDAAGNGISSTYNTDDIAAGSTIFAIWTANHPSGNAGGGQTVTISNIALSYEAAPGYYYWVGSGDGSEAVSWTSSNWASPATGTGKFQIPGNTDSTTVNAIFNNASDTATIAVSGEVSVDSLSVLDGNYTFAGTNATTDSISATEINVSEGATMGLSDIGINSTITNSGTVNLSGTINLVDFQADGGSAGIPAVNGYSNTTTTYRVVDGGTIDATNVTSWLIDGTAAASITFTGGVLSVTVQDTTYYVSSSELEYDGTNGDAAEAAGIALNGNTLKLGVDITGDDDFITATAVGGTLDLNGWTLDQSSLGVLAGETILKGGTSSTYNLGSDTALATKLSLGPDWTGKVKMGDVSTPTAALDLSTLGKEGSSIELGIVDVKKLTSTSTAALSAKSLKVAEASTVGGNLELTDGPLTLGGESAAEMTVNGAVGVDRIVLGNAGSSLTANELVTNGGSITIGVASQDVLDALNTQALNQDITIITLDVAYTGGATLDTTVPASRAVANAAGKYETELVWSSDHKQLQYKASVVSDYVSNAINATSSNGQLGAGMLQSALEEENPQVNAPESGLARALDAVDNGTLTDEGAAAIAGASTAVLGMAAHGDLDRQLQAIRNRTTTMGVDQSVVHHDMPYFNAWINAEGDYSELSDNGTEGGYKLNSWGGTVGFDVDITPTFTAGMALTAMYGDLTITGADDADGDLNTYYVSAFARYCASAWTHTFVASVGMSEFKLSRNIMGEEQESDTNGLSFGLMYEVGRVFALNEDGTACLQPIFNVTWRHTTVDGYEEEGSNLALEVDDQTLDTITLGLGARLQAVVGESMYNRTSIFEARILGKFDAGDTNGTSEVSLAGVTGEVESAERGAFGLEIGAGLTIPMGDEGGSLFMDASLELRADYTNVNGTVGYRVNF